MEYRRLGRSGLMVSTLTLGAMTWGGVNQFSNIGSVEVEEARRQLDLALDAGVNIVDTANIYSWGRSEEILGEVIKGRRNRVLVATKLRSSMGEGANDGGLSRQHIIDACDASLKRLNTDHIDLYQMHMPDGLTPIEETLRAFDDLVRFGKVRYIGVSNFTGWQLMKALGASDHHRLVRPISHQLYYSLIARDAEVEMLPVGVDQEVGAMVWSPLSSGLLSGKYRRDRPEPENTRIANWTIPPRPDAEQLYSIVDILLAVAEARGVTPAQVALAWTLTRPGITTLVLGARTEAQLVENLKAAEVALSNEEIDALEAASRRPLPYPHWLHLALNQDRLSPAERVALKYHHG